MSIWDDLDSLSYEGDDEDYMEDMERRQGWVSGFTQNRHRHNSWEETYDWFIRPPVDELAEDLKKLNEQSRSVERADYDADNFVATAKKSNTLKGVAKKGSLIDERFPTLVEDTFNIFYKGHPFLVDDDKLDEFGKFAKAITRSILDHPKFSGLRSTTKWSELFSAWATRSLDELFESVSGHAPEPQKGDPNEGNEGEQEDPSEQTAGPSEEQEQEGQGQDDSNIPEEGTEDTSEDGSGEGESPEQNGYEVSDSAKQDIDQAVDQFIDKAMDQVAEAQKTQYAWGLDEGSGSSLKDEDVDCILNLLSVSPESKRITEMVGRGQSILDGVETDSESADGTVPTGYSLGDTIAKASPTDLAMLHHPKLKADVFRRAQEGGLQVMERTTPESLGRGPCIALVDGSGSMGSWAPRNDGFPEGTCSKTPANWAAAMAIALYKRASENNQPFILHQFSGHTQSYRYDNPSMQYVEFLKQIMTSEDGGTELEEPLKRAAKSLKEYPEADVVILSDCMVGRKFRDKDSAPVVEFREAIEASGSKAIGVLIAELYKVDDAHNYGPIEREEELDDCETRNKYRMIPYERLCDVAFQIDISDVDAINNITEQIFNEVINE